MFRVLGQAAVAAAMFAIVGGHWAVLQTVAWSQMILEYSQDNSLVFAVKRTFSGEAPCSMCRKIEESRQKQEQDRPSLVKADKKLESFFTTRLVKIIPPAPRKHFFPEVSEPLLAPLAFAPPKPVPRTVASLV